MLAQFSIVPIGKGESVSRFVAEVVKEVDKSGLDYRLTAMATIVEGPNDKVFSLVRRCHDRVKKMSDRVLTTIVIDDRKGGNNCIECKVQSVQDKISKPIKKC